jgi:hypothetical protein
MMMNLVAPGNQWPPRGRVPVFSKDARLRWWMWLWLGFCDWERVVIVVAIAIGSGVGGGFLRVRLGGLQEQTDER